jgi:virginiamycin B lyase
MRPRSIQFVLAACLTLTVSAWPPGLAIAADALIGKVKSAAEGPMEGVVVSAKKTGGAVTVSVVTDREGRYSFPAERLEGGQYALAIRAIGYELDGRVFANLETANTATVDLSLRPTGNLAAHLSNAEWLQSFPGAEAQKKALLNCVGCHDLDRIVKSNYDADQFLQIFERMTGYYPGSTPEHPQRLVGNARRALGQGPGVKATAEYLASINLSKDEIWTYPLKTLPRPTGRATRVIVTEYDLPRKQIQPHDVVVDGEGMVWFSHFGEQFLGKLDPKTGKVWEYPIPMLKEGFPVGTLDLKTDKDGNLWVGMMYQSGVARFDRKTETFKTWSIPKEWQTDAAQSGHVDPTATHVDGKVWVKNSDGSQILRLDPKTGQWENLGSFSDPSNGKRFGVYGIPADRDNNLYLLDFQSSNIGRIDAKTRQFTVHRGAISNSRPRRGEVDDDNRLWFAEYGGNAIGMFDPKSAQIKEWVLPTPWSQPYDVTVDKNGEAWTGSMMSDRVSRLDPRTGQWVEYLLPKTTNIRRVFVEHASGKPAFWVGSNHGASIVKVEPLD